MFIPVPGLVGSLVPLCVLNSIGIVIFGSFLSAEGRRRHATRLLEKEAATDALTGLPNRRTFDAAGSALVLEAKTTGRSVALLMIDLDRFKQVNDRWGHDVGDSVLRKAAGVVASEVRGGGLAARYGGEEIAILLPDVAEDEALRISERIRLAVKQNVYHMHPDLLSVTVSIGVASRQGECLEFTKLFSAADRALYAAKAGGRNQCVLAGPEVERSAGVPDDTPNSSNSTDKSQMFSRGLVGVES